MMLEILEVHTAKCICLMWMFLEVQFTRRVASRNQGRILLWLTVPLGE
nr:hypothetical protein Iba_chr05dCG14460 [Ipomoea batatas]